MKGKKRSFDGIKAVLVKIAAGAIAGLVNGLFGGGGGMIIVPCLKRFLRYKTNSAHATAIAVILPLSVASGSFYIAFGNAEWLSTSVTSIGVLAGGVLGAALLKKLSSKPLTLIFSVVMAVAGVKMLFF
ncbi:MAG: sulfite exporter TauE/SafE family protein [Clostridia bacterium]|nr:sulfite exporter TauE/SafE family protein [Clostridia bacterium]